MLYEVYDIDSLVLVTLQSKLKALTLEHILAKQISCEIAYSNNEEQLYPEMGYFKLFRNLNHLVYHKFWMKLYAITYAIFEILSLWNINEDYLLLVVNNPKSKNENCSQKN